MALYPKRLLSLMTEFPGLQLDYAGNYSLRSTYALDEASFDLPAYFAAADALMQLTRARLTTAALARRIMEVMNVCPRSVLIASIDFDQYGDYQTEALIHGFTKILGARHVVDYPRRLASHQTEHYLQADTYFELHSMLYGGGFTYCCKKQELSAAAERDEAAIRARVHARDFDLVVVTMIDRKWMQTPLLRDVCESYPRARVAIVHGGDKPIMASEILRYTQCGILFSRELETELPS